MDPKTNKVYPHINQTKGDEGFGTGTGRLSYNAPALQQIPSRDREIAAIVRPMFLPDAGQEWVYGDLDQHEFRVFAHYTRDEAILEMYREDPDTDFHQLVADITGLPRSAKRAGEANAKQVNLGIVFSMGAGLLAKQMGLPYTEEMVSFGSREPRLLLKAGPETLKVLNTYHSKIPGVKKVIESASSIAKSRGYVKTLFERHIRFPQRDFAYKAAGLVYQGTSADLNKYNIISLCDLLEGTNSRFLLNIHDEYSMSVDPMDLKNGLIEEAKQLIQVRKPFTYQGACGYQEDALELRVPIRIDFKKGATWWGAINGEDVTTGGHK
jgi:DNA polymerase I-like protein with 3'-5' exonuclease and polymerase domains